MATSRAWFTGAALAIAAAIGAASLRSPVDRAYSSRPRPDPAPPLVPARALRTIQTADSMRVELAAAEPMVEAPVAAQFDEDGRLWVVEMPTYMRDLTATGEISRGNRIVVLEDADGDGVFDRSSVFLDGLLPPRGVSPCFGGALVLEPPNLYFCKDTDGDGRADVKKLLLSGIGVGENPEHAGNSLVRGLDNWYHLSQDKIEFRFDGEKVVTRPTPVVGQWGLAQDDFGRLYYTPNSNPLLTDVYPKHYLSRNRAMNGAPGIGEDIDRDTATWPAHATPGVNRGYIENFLRPDGTLAALTAACGPVVYRAGALGEEFRGDVFICEAAGNLVKRLKLGQAGGLPRASNAYTRTEFLRSTDERFRPVNLVVGPDGALYVLDMYRGLIQHKTYVTPFLARQVEARGLESPLMLGRIYRVSGSPGALRRTERLSAATDAQLAKLLSDPDGWWRDSAQRLLIERRAVGEVPEIRGIAEHGRNAAARVAALWTLEGLGHLSELDVLEALNGEPAVAIAACQLAEGFMHNDGITARIADLGRSQDRQVRIQAAASLGESKGLASRLCEVLRRNLDDRYIRGAVMTGLSGREVAALRLLAVTGVGVQSDGSRAAMEEIADLALRAGDSARSDLIDCLADAKLSVCHGIILERFVRAQRLGSDEPRPLTVAREPSAVMSLGQQEQADPRLRTILDYLDWPGRPAVARKKKPRELTADEIARVAKGRELYTACQGCHQPDGSGSVGMAPPLAGSAIVQGNPDRLARVLLHGMEGPYTMAEMEFTGTMVPAPFTRDEEVAAVMTFIRRSWGNSADPVDAAQVGSVRAAYQGRAKPWTRAEIKAAR